ncbi:MAG: hypothetical protein PVH13_07600 [Gammaproteobacteria bacterium]
MSGTEAVVASPDPVAGRISLEPDPLPDAGDERGSTLIVRAHDPGAPP